MTKTKKEHAINHDLLSLIEDNTQMNNLVYDEMSNLDRISEADYEGGTLGSDISRSKFIKIPKNGSSNLD